MIRVVAEKRGVRGRGGNIMYVLMGEFELDMKARKLRSSKIKLH